MLAPDGVRVGVHELGGSGPPAVLVHGAGFHGRVWRSLAARLGDRLRCLAPDLRGHGDSTLPDGHGLEWSGFGLDLLATVDHLGLECPQGIGHSSGGAALLLAEQARPGTFRALWCYEPVVLGPRPWPGSPPPELLAASARRRRDRFDSREEAHRVYASKPPLRGFAPDVLRAYVDHGLEDAGDGTVRLKCRPAVEAEVYENAAGAGIFERLDQVGCPVTLACGSATDAFGPSVMEALAARLPRARVDVLPGLGHFGPLEDPGAVAQSVVRSLAAAGGGGAGTDRAD